VVAGSSFGCNALLNECGQYACGQANCACQSWNQNLVNEYLHEHADEGRIDSLSNWVGKPAYIFSGTADAVVYQCVMESVRSQLSQLGANVASEFSLPAAHGWVVDGRDFARPYSFPRCGNPGADFIEDCGFDLSSAMLSHLKGPLWPLATAKPASFYWVRQSAFVPDGVRPAQVGLDEWALAYVPDACYGDVGACALHVHYHGCGGGGKRTAQDVRPMLWIETPDLAEANNIVVLYPQTVAASGYRPNPQGCWDWKGDYPSQRHAFDTHNGAQIRTVMGMVNNIAAAVAQGGGPVFPPAEAAQMAKSNQSIVESKAVA